MMDGFSTYIDAYTKKLTLIKFQDTGTKKHTQLIYINRSAAVSLLLWPLSLYQLPYACLHSFTIVATLHPDHS